MYRSHTNEAIYFGWKKKKVGWGLCLVVMVMEMVDRRGSVGYFNRGWVTVSIWAGFYVGKEREFCNLIKKLLFQRNKNLLFIN